MTGIVEGEAPQIAKEEPERLVLRGKPRAVARFRRGVVIGSATMVSAVLIGVTWLALEPPTFTGVAEQESGGQALKGPPEALAGAPGNYSEVPRLGPPLPGDLGRPILEHQREQAAQQELPPVDPAAGAAERARAAAQAERQRQAAALEAARTSAVLVQLTGRPAAAAQAAPQGPVAPDNGLPGDAAPPAGAQRRIAAPSGTADLNHQALRRPAARWMLSAGTIIPASLITGLNSDLPGTVLAQITEHVRDSASGERVLIPQGSRLIGSYNSVVAFGQRRAMLVWQRIVLPDGSSVALDNLPASDVAGYAGLEDRVDFHTWRLLKGIALSTLLGVGTELGLGGGEGDLVRAIRGGVQQNAARAGEQITQRNLDVQPTLRVRPGWPVRAIVNQDLVLQPWRG